MYIPKVSLRLFQCKSARCRHETVGPDLGGHGVSSFASRMTQGIFVGHHGQTRAVLRITKNEVVRGKSWTRQTLSDAWESTNWEVLCGTSWQMVAPERKLTKKVTPDKEGAGTPIAKDRG